MKRKLFLLVLLLVSVFTINVNAKDLPGFYAKESLSLTSPIDSTTFAAGGDVNVKSQINGAGFIAGEDVSISGSQDILFAAAAKLDVENAITKDAFLAGETVKIKNANLRDLFIASSQLDIDSSARNIYAVADKVTINSIIDGNVNLLADRIIIGESAVIKGTIKYPEGANITISKNAVVAKTETYVNVDTNEGETFFVTIAEQTVSCFAIVLIAILLLWAFKKLFTDIEKESFTAKNIAIKAFIGFAALILIPVVAVLLLLTIIGIPLGIITLAIYFILLYLALIPAAYYVGHQLLKGKIKNKYAILSISLVVLKAIELIPILGGLVIALSLFLGLGLWLELIKIRMFAKK